MFAYEFMRHAFLAAGLVALIAGPVGWFLVLRGQSFAGHALSHVGFAGEAAALWLGAPPLAGMVASTILGGVVMGREGDHAVRVEGRDTMIGLVLAASLGIGLFCLQRVNVPGGATTALLFGDVLGVSTGLLVMLGAIAAVVLAGLAFIARPLLFASLDPAAAAAAGVRVGMFATLFMAMAALAVSACTEVTGVLMTFSLLIGPASCMVRLGLAPLAGMGASALLALALAWCGLAASWWSDAPVAFFIGTGGAACYVVALGVTSMRNGR